MTALTQHQKMYLASGVHRTIDAEDGNELRTLVSLVKKGIFTKRPHWIARFDITDKGDDLRRKLQVCPHCGEDTHPFEAGCLGCGALKPWAA